MSELSTSEARKLMEVYTSMCAPQQENLSEEVEQIDEVIRPTTGQQTAPKTAPAPAARPQVAGGGMGGRRGSGSSPGGVKPTFQSTGGFGRYSSPSMQQRTTNPAAPAKPAATKPAAPAATKPAAAKPTPSAPTAPKPATPARTFNPLMQKTFGYQTGNAPDQIAKASAGAPPTPSGSALGAAAKPEVRTSLNLPAKSATAPEVKKTAAIAATSKSTPVAPGYQGAKKPFGEEMDAYDLVLEYLLDNGHVDSVDEAHYVMLEMNSEEIQDIVEARKSYSAKAARSGKDIGLPGKGFEKIATEAGKRYGSKERGEKVAGAVLAGLRAKYSK